MHVGAVPDDADALLEHLRAQILAHDADLVVTSGGVSMGAFEVVRHAAAREGAVLAFPKVAVQPGGPQGIGTLAVEDRASPGSRSRQPGSALLSCEFIARPALGAPARRRLRLPLQLEAEETPPPALDSTARPRCSRDGCAWWAARLAPDRRMPPPMPPWSSPPAPRPGATATARDPADPRRRLEPDRAAPDRDRRDRDEQR